MSATTKAIVLEDGEIIPERFIDQYAFKNKNEGESNQIPADAFMDSYSEQGLVTPLYNPSALAELLEINTYHYRAVKTKARDTAGLGWYLEPKEGIDNPSEGQKLKAENFLKKPNPDETLSEVNEKAMVDFEAIGDAYFEVVRNSDGEVISLYHIPSHTVRVHKDLDRFIQKRGKSKAWFKKFGLEKDVHSETGVASDLGTLEDNKKANDLIHISNYTSRSDYYGLPDVMPSLGAILGDRERQEYNISFFDNHAIPAYAVTVTGADLDSATEKKIQKFFQQDVKKANHSTLVLTASKDDNDPSADPIKFEFQALSTEMKEASFRMFRQDNRDEVLSAHGVPPYRAGVTVEGQLGGSSAGESTEIYKQSIVKPKQETLENIINRFILEEGLEITDWVFHFKQIDTRDVDKEIERLAKLVDMGAYSPNMVLDELGKEKSEDPAMDVHFIGGQPIDATNEQAQSVIRSMKDLHGELIKIATKGSN